jgi:hypothetical protein
MVLSFFVYEVIICGYVVLKEIPHHLITSIIDMLALYFMCFQLVVGMIALVVSINDGLVTILPLLRLNIVNCYVVCIKTSDALLHGFYFLCN